MVLGGAFHRTALVRIFALGASALLLSACSLTGGGWMPGADSGKATLGFNLVCNETSGFMNGSWTYHDKASGVNIGGTLTDTSGSVDLQALINDEVLVPGPIPCGVSIQEAETLFALMYTARPSHDTGWAIIIATDTGRTGPNKGDGFAIQLFDSALTPWYENEQTLSGGNLTVGS